MRRRRPRRPTNRPRDDAYARARRRTRHDRRDVSADWRAEYTAQGAALPDGGSTRGSELEPGDRVRDRDDDADAGDGEVLLVVDVTDDRADEHEIDALGATVAEVNEEYSPASPVVRVAYPDALNDGEEPNLDGLRVRARFGEEELYSFPAARLAPVDSRDGGDAGGGA